MGGKKRRQYNKIYHKKKEGKITENKDKDKTRKVKDFLKKKIKK